MQAYLVNNYNIKVLCGRIPFESLDEGEKPMYKVLKTHKDRIVKELSLLYPNWLKNEKN